jgi:hypothetical protein
MAFILNILCCSWLFSLKDNCLDLPRVLSRPALVSNTRQLGTRTPHCTGMYACTITVWHCGLMDRIIHFILSSHAVVSVLTKHVDQIVGLSWIMFNGNRAYKGRKLKATVVGWISINVVMERILLFMLLLFPLNTIVRNNDYQTKQVSLVWVLCEFLLVIYRVITLNKRHSHTQKNNNNGS